MRATSLLIIVGAFVLGGCGGSDQAEPPAGHRFLRGDEADLPAQAQSALRARPGVVRAHCWTRHRFIEHALGAHPTLDLVAFPARACVVVRDNGRTVDLFRIRGIWLRIGRFDGG